MRKRTKAFIFDDLRVTAFAAPAETVRISSAVGSSTQGNALNRSAIASRSHQPRAGIAGVVRGPERKRRPGGQSGARGL